MAADVVKRARVQTVQGQSVRMYRRQWIPRSLRETFEFFEDFVVYELPLGPWAFC